MPASRLAGNVEETGQGEGTCLPAAAVSGLAQLNTEPGCGTEGKGAGDSYLQWGLKKKSLAAAPVAMAKSLFFRHWNLLIMVLNEDVCGITTHYQARNFKLFSIMNHFGFPGSLYFFIPVSHNKVFFPNF